MTTIAEAREDGLLRALRDVFAAPHEQLTCGIGDDAAVLEWRGDLVATVDSIEAGTDWVVEETPRDAIGWRAAAVNLSDLAAMGARPVALLVAVDIPAEALLDDVVASAKGLVALARRHGATVAGGDISIGTSERWTVTAMGDLHGRALTRDRARSGDVVWLIGRVGMAAVGLAAQLRGAAACPDSIQACLERHLRPEPLVEAGQRLQRSGARLATIDVSDGVARDAGHLARASGVSLELNLPRPGWLDQPAASWCADNGVDWRAACACGGDDYALLACAAPDVDVAALLTGLDVPVSPIGTVVSAAGREAVTVTVDGRPCALSGGGFVHG